MPKGDGIALLHDALNGPALAPVGVSSRNGGTLGGGLRLRLGLFRGGLSGSFYIAEQINRHKS